MKALPILAAMLAALPACADEQLVSAQYVIVDPSLPPAQRDAEIQAARRYATFWHTGDERHARAALAAGFTDRTLPPGRAQGVPGPLAASRFVRTAIPDLQADLRQMIVAGDRVTVRDWFELSLKESLTSLRQRQFASDTHSAAVKLIDDADVLRSGQFIEDSGPGAHFVRPERVEEFDNIYSTTIYQKGKHVLAMMNTILGGQFSSRLNLNLREKNGFTYGAGSSFAMRQGPGPFSTSGAIVREHTAAAVREMFSEIDTMRSTLVTEAELSDARELLIRQLQAYFESTDELTSLMASLAIQGLPLDEFARRPEKLRQVTPADIQRVARQYIVPDRLRVVIVGDATAIEPGLAALKLGKIEVRKPPAAKKPADTTTADNAAKKPVDARPGAPTRKPASGDTAKPKR